MSAIKAKFKGKCSQCGKAIEVGQKIFYRSGKGARHTVCKESGEAPRGMRKITEKFLYTLLANVREIGNIYDNDRNPNWAGDIHTALRHLEEKLDGAISEIRKTKRVRKVR